MNSYATLEYADAFLASLLGTDGWTQATDGDKERALGSATLAIDTLETNPGLRGTRKTPDQAQAFPRSFEEGVSDTVKQACCLEAAALLEDNADPAAKRRERAIRQGVVSESVGDASESYVKRSELAQGGTSALRSPAALALLHPYRTIQGVYPIR